MLLSNRISLYWYISRLRTISAPEFFYRIQQFLQRKFEKHTSFEKSLKVKLEEWPSSVINSGDLSSYNVEEDFDIFGTKFDFHRNINWHQDIITKAVFSRTFAKEINIRSTKNISAKVVWEVNRLQFLTIIAIKYRQTREKKFINLFRSICDSWINENPYLIGVNWYSNLEINLRLITWFLSWEIMDISTLVNNDEDFKKFVKEKLIPCIYQHCYYSYHNLSKYSSANNHLISEYTGLYIASSFWKFKESPRWKNASKKGLEKEILRQHSTNGINKEEAAEYIQFITDFFLLAYIIGQKCNDEFSLAYQRQLKNVINYINDFLDCRGNFPNYGDEDDGKTFILSNEKNFNNFKSIVTSGAVLFQESKFKSDDCHFDLKNQILFGDAGKEQFDRLMPNKSIKSSSFYSKEGHFIFRKQADTEKEIYMHFDIAPLGYLSIAAHGHADCLSFLLNIDGKPVLIDSGTYTYHTNYSWRKYFVGTISHNTARIDKKDQAELAGPTLWLKHFKPEIIENSFTNNTERVVGSYNNYYTNDIKHIREIIFLRDKNEFEIIDSFDVYDGREHFVELPFHIHPDCNVSETDKSQYLIINNNTRNVKIIVDKKLKLKHYHGNEDPILGWHSPSFMRKTSCLVLFNVAQINKSTIFNTKIKIEE